MYLNYMQTTLTQIKQNFQIIKDSIFSTKINYSSIDVLFQCYNRNPMCKINI